MTEGKLFVVQMPPSRVSKNNRIGQKISVLRRVEHYWMCDNCAQELTIFYEAGSGIVTVPLTSARKPVASTATVPSALGVALAGRDKQRSKGGADVNPQF